MVLYLYGINVVIIMTTKSEKPGGTIVALLAIAVITSSLLAAPVMAMGVKFISGPPVISASVLGVNEFSPGDEVPLTIVIENTGKIDLKILRSDLISRDELTTTAYRVSADLAPGEAPLTVKTDTQRIGDIHGGTAKTVTYTVKIDQYAVAGSYMMDLDLVYDELTNVEQYGSDALRYFWQNDRRKTVQVPIRIRSEAILEVPAISIDEVNVGTEGYLTLSLKNAGSVDATSAVAKIVRSGTSPIIPTDAAVYIGDFPSGEIIDCRFKVSVSRDAEAATYPLQVYLEYEDDEGTVRSTERRTVGIPVGGKVDLVVTQVRADLSPGDRNIIEVTYMNVGDTTAYRAQSRISAVDPFTSSDDTAYLGDIGPGESAVARYSVTVDRGATVKAYGLDTEIRYRDALDNTVISDTMKAEVMLSERKGVTAYATSPVLLLAVAALLIGAGYYIFSRQKKK